jgi:ABC-type thiamine transport system substrate-binding protein
LPYLNNINEKSLFNCINPISKKLRHAAWSKLLSTKKTLLLDYDYIVYIDSDCIFKDFNQSLEEFIKPSSDNNIIFLNNKPWNDDYPCSGFYICKVNNYTRQFVEDWYNINAPKYDRNHEWEQVALWYLFKQTAYINSYNIKLIDGWMFEEKEQQFLRHIGHNRGDQRIPYFKSFIKSKNIDYEETINKIKVIPYNTNM